MSLFNRTIDQLHTMDQFKVKCQEYNIPVSMAFIDYEKAFDSVETQSILASLHEQTIEDPTPGYNEILKDIYIDSTEKLKLQENNEMNIKKGVRWGDAISPKLFTIYSIPSISNEPTELV